MLRQHCSEPQHSWRAGRVLPGRLGISRQRVNAMLAHGLPRGADLLIPVAGGLTWVRVNVDPVRSRAQRRARGPARRPTCPTCGGLVTERPPGMPEVLWRHRHGPVLCGCLAWALNVMRRIEPVDPEGRQRRAGEHIEAGQ